MVSIAALLKYEGTTPFGGVLGLSGMRALDNTGMSFTKEQLKAKRNTPLFLYHG